MAAKLLADAKDKVDVDAEAALEDATKAEELFKASGDKAGQMDAFRLIVSSTLALGQHQNGLTMANGAVEEAREADDRKKLASCLITAAEAHLYIGYIGEAQQFASEGRSLFQGQGEPSTEAKAALVEAHACLKMGDTREAVRVATQAQVMFEKAKDAEGEAQAWQMLATARMNNATSKQGDVISAIKKALSMYKDLGDRKNEGVMTAYMGQALLSEKPEEALKQALDAFSIFKKLGYTKGEAQALEVAVNAHASLGQSAEASGLVKERMAFLDDKAKALLTPVLINAYLNKGVGESPDVEAALTAATDGLSMVKGQKREEAIMMNRIAEILLLKGEAAEAVKEAEAAARLFRKVGDVMGQTDVNVTLTKAYTATKQADKAPYRLAGVEYLGQLVQAVAGRDQQSFEEAFGNIQTWGGVDQIDIDSSMKPLFKRDPGAQKFFTDCKGAYFGMAVGSSDTSHLKTSKLIHNLDLYIGQRWGQMGYGPSFRCAHSIYRNGKVYQKDSETQSLTVIQDDTLESWEAAAVAQAHPGLMDAALQVQGVSHMGF
mmetsp:Transcript_130582/g.279210  ORF Transcript_130582/g.279210 Transcript_130582/m.279210 type:complete len:548 (+) Transcript_130582:68-1711(+)